MRIFSNDCKGEFSPVFFFRNETKVCLEYSKMTRKRRIFSNLTQIKCKEWEYSQYCNKFCITLLIQKWIFTVNCRKENCYERVRMSREYSFTTTRNLEAAEIYIFSQISSRTFSSFFDIILECWEEYSFTTTKIEEAADIFYHRSLRKIRCWCCCVNESQRRTRIFKCDAKENILPVTIVFTVSIASSPVVMWVVSLRCTRWLCCGCVARCHSVAGVAALLCSQFQ